MYSCFHTITPFPPTDSDLPLSTTPNKRTMPEVKTPIFVTPLHVCVKFPNFAISQPNLYRLKCIAGASIRTFGFTNGVGRIWLDDVHCRGNETRLIDCPARPLGSHGCSHVEDAGVRCIPCTSGDIRLQGGTATSGRVEICQRSEWGTVCYDFWGPADAQVACRQLGFEPTGKRMAG